MSFENFEFPHTNFYNSDLRELIAMYRKLVRDYSSIKAEIDQAVDFINNFGHYVDDAVSSSIENKLSVVNGKIEAITEAIKRIDLNIDDIENNYEKLYLNLNKLEGTLHSELISIRLEISELYDEFAIYKHSIDDIVANKIEEMILYIDEHVQQIERLYVINPITGTFENVQYVLNMFAEYLSLGYGLTAYEYDSLHLSAISYDNMRVTALAYSMRGYLIFFKRLKMMLLSPFTGDFDTYDNIIYSLADLHKDSATADEYDAGLITSDVYDSISISAYNYDWYSKTILTMPIERG